MAAIPAAHPSILSIALKALATPVIQSTVIIADKYKFGIKVIRKPNT